MTPPAAETRVTEVEIARAQLKIPKPLWDEIKIQAIRENLTAEQLAAKIFEAYIVSMASR